MRDLIRALRGKRHCAWCDNGVYDTTWWERLMRFDQCIRNSERPWHERAAMEISYLADKGPFSWPWRLARRIHFHLHVSAERRAEYYG